MAATGKTPILLYGSTTPTNAPTAGNLTNSSDGCEIAINIADKNLFFKDSTNAVNTVPIRQSSASSNGWLSSTDWSTFNGKQPAGSYALTTGTLAQFASTTSAQLAGVISDETGSGVLVFGTSPTISTPTLTGNITASTGNLVIGTSGKGIDFSATADATATSELLADYEEGTWTPAYSCSSGAFGTITYGLQTGTYTKIGRMVSISCFFRTNSVAAGTAAGNLVITGLPYVPKSSQIYLGEIGFSSNFSGGVNPTDIVCNAGTVFLYYRATSAGASGVFLANGATGLTIGANTGFNYLMFSLVYEV